MHSETSALGVKNILNKFFEIAIEIDNLIKTSSTWKIENSQNSSWDVQAKLDVLSDILVEKKLKELKEIKAIVSEEKDWIVEVNNSWKYLIAYDPLDWSSLIDVDLSVGTIFGIYENDFKGSDLVASCYIVYGPRVEVVFADKNWVSFFRLISLVSPHSVSPKGREAGQFSEIKINNLNNKGNILSPGAKNADWLEYHKNIINNFWEQWYKLRYSGGMVPDLHQILLKWWWLFTYPELKNKPEWKLRKLFEVFPFAFIFEKLWWQAIDKNWTRILDLWYEKLHEPVSCYFGSEFEINFCRDVLLKHLT
jgi:fructose-1,6-bisphosphatase I